MRLECNFTVNKTKEAVKVQTLIMGLSAVQYQTIRNLMAPDKPAAQTCKNVVEHLSTYYGGRLNPMTERVKFCHTFRKGNAPAWRFCARDIINELDVLVVVIIS